MMYKIDDCKLIDRLLNGEEGSSIEALPAEAEAHLRECARCRALLKSLRQGDSFALSDEALSRLHDPILAQLRPVRPLPPRIVFVFVFLGIYILLVVAGAYRMGSFGWDELSTFQKLVIFTSLAASAALLSFSTVQQMVPGSKQWVSPALLPPVIFVFLCLVVAALFQYARDPEFVRLGMGCLEGGIPFAIPSALLFWWILSRGARLHPYISGMTAGLLAGLVGTGVLEMHCPILDASHIIVWHMGVALCGAGAGLACAVIGTASSRLNKYA